MSRKDRDRLGTIHRIRAGELTVTSGAAVADLSVRQMRRLVGRVRLEGDEGLLHRGLGRPSSRQADPEMKAHVLELHRTTYKGFGPTFFGEKLREVEGIDLSRETLRQWLSAAGLHKARTRKAEHRQWRERKAHFGELVQMDGSYHQWFGPEHPWCYLMSMVDDATGDMLVLHSEQETTFAAMSLLQAWIELYGIPMALYVDGKSTYIANRKQTFEEEVAGLEPLSQFGRACNEVGIKLIHAHSPQAKGRVERKHQVCQDRLIKEYRLAGITDIASANAFLPAWTPRINTKFTHVSASCEDYHRPLTADHDLENVFCIKEERCLTNDFTLQYKRKWLQVVGQPGLPRPRSKVTVSAHRDGTLTLSFKGRSLRFNELPGRPVPVKKAAGAAPVAARFVPSADHPWRGKQALPSDPRRFNEDTEALALSYLPPNRIGRYDHGDGTISGSRLG